MYKFEKLNAWQESLRLIKIIYDVINKLPEKERYCLIDQLRRAATSVSLNIAEGCGSSSDKEFRSYLKNSIKSLYEVVACLKIIEKIYPKIIIKECYTQSELVGKLINGLIRSLSKDYRLSAKN